MKISFVQLFDFSFLKFIYTALILIVALSLILISRKFLQKRKNRNYFSIYLFIISAIFLCVVSSILFLLVKNFGKIVIYENKYFFIKAVDVIYIIITLTLSFVSLKFLKIILLRNRNKTVEKNDVKQKTFLLLKYIFLVIVIGIVLKIILKDTSIIESFEFFKVKNTSITVYDIFHLSVVISLTSLLLLILRRFFSVQADNKKIDEGTGNAVYKIGKYIIWVIAIVVILQSSGFDISIILAGSAALLVGLGMGIQNIFSDIVSGIILLIERPLKKGDIVEIGDMVGEVLNTGIRTTSVLSRENVIVIVPNSDFTSGKIINWSNLNKNTRFKIEVGVAYGSDVPLVIETLRQCACSHEKILKKPQPFVRFNNFGNSSLDFQLFFWTSENLRVENIKSDVRILIDGKFRENKIKIPFPQRDIHIIKSSE